jgi:hypothetical protein
MTGATMTPSSLFGALDCFADARNDACDPISSCLDHQVMIIRSWLEIPAIPRHPVPSPFARPSLDPTQKE